MSISTRIWIVLGALVVLFILVEFLREIPQLRRYMRAKSM